jgi:hypothetical protein
VTGRLTTTRTFLIVVFLGLFAMAGRNITDPDLWWHLKTGEYIAQHGSVPHADPFSYTRAGQPWVAHEWLTDLLLYALHRATGTAGLIAVFAAILCTAFFFLYLRCGPDPYVAGVAVLFTAWATMPVWGVRPQVISLLLTSLWLLILERSERNSKLLWWTLPLTLLWVNLHAGFALGLALSALFLLGEGIELCRDQSARHSTRLWFAAFILLLDFLIVPLNPNGARLFVYPVETLRSAAMQNYIAEWASPNFHHAEYLPFLLIVLATIAALAWSRPRLRLRDLVAGQPLRRSVFDSHDSVVRFRGNPRDFPPDRKSAHTTIAKPPQIRHSPAVEWRNRPGNGSLRRHPSRSRHSA